MLQQRKAPIKESATGLHLGKVNAKWSTSGGRYDNDVININNDVTGLNGLLCVLHIRLFKTYPFLACGQDSEAMHFKVV